MARPLRRLAFAAAALALAPGALLAWANLPAGEPLPPGARADAVRVEKGARLLHLLRDGEVLRTYPVSLGGAPAGDKEREGDERTPQGRYVLDFRKEDSRYHRALHVSYPDAADRAAARARGDDPGGDIMVHGLPNGLGWVGRLHLLADWTDGCVALTNREMDEVWRAVADGAPIEIVP